MPEDLPPSPVLPRPGLAPASLLATALNALLERQPRAAERLQRHLGKTVCLALPLLELRLTLHDTGKFEAAAEEADTSLTLTPQISALPRFLFSTHPNGGSVSDIFSAAGDGLMAADISHALADFDWVLALRPYLGDIAATRVDQFIQSAHAWRTQAVEATGRNLAEYAVHEEAMLANPIAVREFIAEVDALREGADRLDARLALLESTAKSANGQH